MELTPDEMISSVNQTVIDVNNHKMDKLAEVLVCHEF